MPFAATTRDRVMGALELPVVVYYCQRVDDALAHAETHGGETTVTRIEGYLTQYETQQTALSAEAGNAGLVKAGPLEWSVGGKVNGVKSEMARLRKLIARSLLLDRLMKGNTVRVLR